MEQERIEIIVALKDELSRPAKRVEDSIDKIGNEADDTHGSVRDLDGALDDLGDTARESSRHLDGAASAHHTFGRNIDTSTKSVRRHESVLKKTMQTFRGYASQIKSLGMNYFSSLQMYRVLFTDMGAMIPQLITGVYSLGAGLAALMGPLGRVAGVAGQAIPIFGAFGQSMAVIMLSMKNIPDAIKVLTDPKITPAETLAVYEALGPAVASFTKALLDMREPLGRIRSSTQDTFLKGMDKSIERVTRRTLPALERGLKKTAREMNKGLSSSIKQLTTKENIGNLELLMGFGANISGSMSKGLAPLLEIVTKIGVAAGPAAARTMSRMADSLQRISDGIDVEKLTDWFMKSADSGSALWTSVKNLASGLGGVARAASGLSGSITESWMDRLQRFAEWSNSDEGQKSMSTFFESMRPNIEALGNVFGSIAEAVHDISGSPYFADFMNMLADDGIPALADIVKALDEEVNPALMNLGDALSKINIEGVFKPLGVILDGVASAVDLIATGLEKIGAPGSELVGLFIGLKAIGAADIMTSIGKGALNFGKGLKKGGLKGGLGSLFGDGGLGSVGTMTVNAGVVNVLGGAGLPGSITGAGKGAPGVLGGVKGALKNPKNLKNLGKFGAGAAVAGGTWMLGDAIAGMDPTLNDPELLAGTSSALKGASAGMALGPLGAAAGLGLGLNYEFGPGENTGQAKRYKEKADQALNPAKYATSGPATPYLRELTKPTMSAPGSALSFAQRSAEEQTRLWNEAKRAVSEFGTVFNEAGAPSNIAVNDEDYAALETVFSRLDISIDTSKTSLSELDAKLNSMPVAKNIEVTANTAPAMTALSSLTNTPWSTTVTVGYNSQGFPTTNGVVDFARAGKGDVKGARWAGGPVETGKYLVGELGRELFVGKDGSNFEVGTGGPEVRHFTSPGYIVPNSALEGAKDALAQAAGGSGRRGAERAAEGQETLPSVQVIVQGNVGADVDIERAVMRAMRKARNEQERRR